MKKLLSFALALMLALSSAGAFAELSTQNEYNLSEKEGETLVYNNVEGFYLWSVPAEVTLQFTPKEASADYFFGKVAIWNVLFNTDSAVNALDDEKHKKLDKNKLITISLKNREDLVFSDVVYVKDEDILSKPEYIAAGTPAGYAEKKYSDLSAEQKAAFNPKDSKISTAEWKLHKRQYESSKNTDGIYSVSTEKKFGDKTFTFFPSANEKIKELMPEQGILSVLVLDDNGTSYLASLQSVTENGTVMQDLNKFVPYNEGTFDKKNPETFNAYLMQNLGKASDYLDGNEKMTEELFYTCFGIPSVLGKHEGKVTYEAKVTSVQGFDD